MIFYLKKISFDINFYLMTKHTTVNPAKDIMLYLCLHVKRKGKLKKLDMFASSWQSDMGIVDFHYMLRLYKSKFQYQCVIISCKSTDARTMITPLSL